MIDSIILTVVPGILIMCFKLYDPDKHIESFYMYNDVKKYYLLQLALGILTISCIVHGRHLVSMVFQMIKKYYF